MPVFLQQSLFHNTLFKPIEWNLKVSMLSCCLNNIKHLSQVDSSSSNKMMIELSVNISINARWTPLIWRYFTFYFAKSMTLVEVWKSNINRVMVIVRNKGRIHQNSDDCFQSECSQDANFIQKSLSSEIMRSFSMVELLLFECWLSMEW